MLKQALKHSIHNHHKQRMPRLRSWLLAPALSGSGSEPGVGAGAGNFGCGSGSRAQSWSQASQRSEK
uniref:Uncharacterized protein n=1 Tax=Bursaphelenchus xylophilus TaxID=6326 RepID=A0A1I7SV03_BURXY